MNGPPRLGSLVYDEVILPVWSITLERGMILVHASAYLDATINEKADMALFGADGVLILRVPSGGQGVVHQSAHGGHMSANLPIVIASADRTDE